MCGLPRLFTLLLTIGLAGVQLARAGPAEALEEAFPGCTPRHCVVTKNEGGDLGDYNLALYQMLLVGIRHVVVDARCTSSCASTVDLAREVGIDVCITSRASFAFHKASLQLENILVAGTYDTVVEVNDYFDPPQTPGVREWVLAHGGFPIGTGKHMLRMSAQEASRFWRWCGPRDGR